MRKDCFAISPLQIIVLLKYIILESENFSCVRQLSVFKWGFSFWEDLWRKDELLNIINIIFFSL